MRLLFVQVSTVLDRKEALLMQLRAMNDEAESGMHLDSSGRHTEAFQAAYAKVVLELKQARSCHPSSNCQPVSLASSSSCNLEIGKVSTITPVLHGCHHVSHTLKNTTHDLNGEALVS